MAAEGNSGNDLILAHQVPQTIRFLRKHLKLRATHIARIFGESADNIRHLVPRAKANPVGFAVPSIPEDDLELIKLSAEQRKTEYRLNMRAIRIRTKQDLNQVEKTVWAIFREHQSVGLQEAYEALLAIRPDVANAKHDKAAAVQLLVAEKLAWFALPLGRLEKALIHSEEAMQTAADAFRESAGEKSYLLRYGEAALIASICLQKLHQPERAFAFIRAADDANRAAGERPGSEHLRQRGAALVQMGQDGKDYDDLAERQFKRAPNRMLRKNEARHEVDLSMSGIRQRAFLNPAWGWDKVLELADSVEKVYGESSMQYAVAAKSAAVAGLKYATPESTSTALDLLYKISPSSPEKPAKGVRHILSITPDLRLSPADLDRWLRFAMNEAPLPRK